MAKNLDATSSNQTQAMTTKSKGGRPRAFESVEQLQEGIDAYLADCVMNERPLTVSGLAADLGVDRQTVFEYQRGTYGAEYSYPIKKVVYKIEAQQAEGMITGKLNTTGAIFSLKNNHGWEDRKQVERSGETTQKIIRVTVADDKAMDEALEDEF